MTDEDLRGRQGLRPLYRSSKATASRYRTYPGTHPTKGSYFTRGTVA